jgi:hypothetical protein
MQHPISVTVAQTGEGTFLDACVDYYVMKRTHCAGGSARKFSEGQGDAWVREEQDEVRLQSPETEAREGTGESDGGGGERRFSVDDLFARIDQSICAMNRG